MGETPAAWADDARGILARFAAEPGRSCYAVLQRSASPGEWSGGVDEDSERPMASLAKLPLAMALEPMLPSLAPQRVDELLTHVDGDSVLWSLEPDRRLAPAEMLRLMLSTSDNPCARWAVTTVGIGAVKQACRASGARATRIDDDGMGGVTTARDAVTLLRAAADGRRYPVSASALSHSTRNARIPLGVTDSDFAMAHKTGTLAGVANDVAHLTCDRGAAWIAFLSEEQHDLLVTGYAMGLVTRALLEHAGLRVRSTVSVMA